MCVLSRTGNWHRSEEDGNDPFSCKNWECTIKDDANPTRSEISLENGKLNQMCKRENLEKPLHRLVRGPDKHLLVGSIIHHP